MSLDLKTQDSLNLTSYFLSRRREILSGSFKVTDVFLRILVQDRGMEILERKII